MIDEDIMSLWTLDGEELFTREYYDIWLKYGKKISILQRILSIYEASIRG